MFCFGRSYGMYSSLNSVLVQYCSGEWKCYFCVYDIDQHGLPQSVSRWTAHLVETIIYYWHQLTLSVYTVYPSASVKTTCVSIQHIMKLVQILSIPLMSWIVPAPFNSGKTQDGVSHPTSWFRPVCTSGWNGAAVCINTQLSKAWTSLLLLSSSVADIILLQFF